MNKKFVMIGEKDSKGKIVKNQSMNIDEFIKLISGALEPQVLVVDKPKNVTFWDRVFNTAKYKQSITHRITKILDANMTYLAKTIKGLISLLLRIAIETDNFGKTAKAEKVKKTRKKK